MCKLLMILAIILLAGCRSVRVVDVDPNDPVVLKQVSDRAARQEAVVQLTDPSRTPDKASRLAITTDSVRLAGSRVSLPLADVHQVRFESRGGPGRGALIGGLVGGLGLGLIAAADNEPCDDADWCVMEFSDSQAFGMGFLMGALGGAVIGGIVGAVTGSPGVIYRFRRGTPGQLSVVIGVSRNPSMDGRARMQYARWHGFRLQRYAGPVKEPNRLSGSLSGEEAS